MLFGIDALSYRLQNSGAKALITNAQGVAKLAEIREQTCRSSSCVLSIDGAAEGALDFAATLARASSDFTPVDTAADDPAMMIYTSGTTGQPKGALHGASRAARASARRRDCHDFFPQAGDRIWTPADWAWAGGLLDVLLPSLHHGVPVVARRFEKFDPEEAFALMAARADAQRLHPADRAAHDARGAQPARAATTSSCASIGSGGESLGAETLRMGQVGASASPSTNSTARPNATWCCRLLRAIGVLAAGRDRQAGARPHGGGDRRATAIRCKAGEPGQIAVKRPDPVMFLEYWGKPEATRDKFIGDWMTTGDQGVMDEDGYISFVGRDDDVITSAGFRIGPGEIEDCLIRHPAVALAAAVGKPDPLRTEIVKAFIVLKKDYAPSDALAAEIQGFVKTRLSGHEYPREVAFIDDMPMTTTGKVIRRLLRERA